MALAVTTNWGNDTIRGSTTGTAHYTTTVADEIVLLFISYEPNSSATPSVASVTDANGLTWTRRGTPFSFTSASPATFVGMEVWWAHCSAIVGLSAITVTLSAAVDDGSLCTMSVSGVTNFTNPFDTNVSLPATLFQSAAANASLTINTSLGDALVFGFTGSANNGGKTAVAPFAISASSQNNNGTNYSYEFVETNNYAAPQTGLAVSMASSVGDYGFIVDALTGSSAPLPPAFSRALFVGA